MSWIWACKISSLLPLRFEEWLRPIQSRFHVPIEDFSFMIKGEDFSFTKHMRIKSRSSNKNKNPDRNPFAPHPERRILFEFQFVHFESFLSSTSFLISFFSWILYFISIFLLLSHRYRINREPFLLYESILLHSNFFPIPPKENPQLDPKLTG